MSQTAGPKSLDPFIKALPKADMHTHVEGTLKPAKAQELGVRNGIELNPALFNEDGSYYYEDFLDLVTKTYQAVANVMKTRQDYEEVVYEYLKECAAENTVYAELIACPGQCEPDRAGIDYKEMIDGIAAGIDRARQETGIEARINVTFERHRGPGNGAERDAERILSYPHDYIVGLDIAGGEQNGDLAQFQGVYQYVLENFGRKLGVRMHAGEGAGPENVADALNLFDASRIGHGVRSIESESVIRKLKERGATLEVCPTSNICLMPQYNGDYKSHPARDLFDKGVNIVFGADDPPMHEDGSFTACSIGTQYQLARDEWGFTEPELVDITMRAIDVSFADQSLKQSLRKKAGNIANTAGQKYRNNPGQRGAPGLDM